MSARKVIVLLTAVAAAASGFYMIVYLFRWQWNRALIAAIFFVAAEVALMAMVLLERLNRIERAIQDAPVSVARTAADDDLDRIRTHLRAAQAPPSRHFAWLQDSATRHNVFLPVLLGAGVIMSGIAWLVESVAKRVAQPALDRPAVAALGRLSFPVGGLLGSEGPPPVRERRFKKWMLVPGALLVIAMLGFGIDFIADATQTRPDEIDEGVVTMIDVRLAGVRPLNNLEQHGTDLYWACAAESFAASLPEPLVVAINDTDVRYLVHADLGEHGGQRFTGCIEDVVIPETQATVLQIQEFLVDEDAPVRSEDTS